MGIEVDVYTSDINHNDRGILEGLEEGCFVKILCRKGTEEILGGVIVSERAGTMAGMAVQNALFEGQGLPVNAPSNKLSELVVPRCTYTEPEVASCGIANVDAAKKQGIEVDVYTSDINLTQLPPRLVVIGGGPIGLEMAQAFRRFGSEVTVLEAFGRILGPEDADASKVIHRVLDREGVQIFTSAKIVSVYHVAADPWPQITISLCTSDSQPLEIVCDVLMVATGRIPNVEGLDLEKAGVEYAPRVGIKVNDDLTTTNRDILAVGDVIDRPELRFTHGAGTMAGKAVFTGPHELEVDGRPVKFRKAVVATGGRAMVPPIPGLNEVPYMTLVGIGRSLSCTMYRGMYTCRHLSN